MVTSGYPTEHLELGHKTSMSRQTQATNLLSCVWSWLSSGSAEEQIYLPSESDMTQGSTWPHLITRLNEHLELGHKTSMSRQTQGTNLLSCVWSSLLAPKRRTANLPPAQASG